MSTGCQALIAPHAAHMAHTPQVWSQRGPFTCYIVAACLLLSLFPSCYTAGGIRRALFKLERGVCQLCQLDCHALVGQLQQISRESPHWLQHRWVGYLLLVWGWCLLPYLSICM